MTTKIKDLTGGYGYVDEIGSIHKIDEKFVSDGLKRTHVFAVRVLTDGSTVYIEDGEVVENKSDWCSHIVDKVTSRCDSVTLTHEVENSSDDTVVVLYPYSVKLNDSIVYFKGYKIVKDNEGNIRTSIAHAIVDYPNERYEIGFDQADDDSITTYTMESGEWSLIRSSKFNYYKEITFIDNTGINATYEQMLAKVPNVQIACDDNTTLTYDGLGDDQGRKPLRFISPNNNGYLLLYPAEYNTGMIKVVGGLLNSIPRPSMYISSEITNNAKNAGWNYTTTSDTLNVHGYYPMFVGGILPNSIHMSYETDDGTVNIKTDVKASIRKVGGELIQTSFDLLEGSDMKHIVVIIETEDGTLNTTVTFKCTNL